MKSSGLKMRLEDVQLDMDFITKHQINLIRNLKHLISSRGGRFFSNDFDNEESEDINPRIQKWAKELESSDKLPPAQDIIVEMMKNELLQEENKIIEVRKILKKENENIIRTFKKQLISMIQERSKMEEYRYLYEKQFSAILEMISAIKIDNIFSWAFEEDSNLLYGSYIFLTGGIEYYVSIMATAIVFQIFMIYFLFGYLPIYKLYNTPDYYDEGTMMPENLLDIVYVRIKNLNIEPIISEIVYKIYNIMPKSNKIFRIISHINHIINKEEIESEVNERVEASMLLYDILNLCSISGAIFDMACFAINNSRLLHEFLGSKHIKYKIRVLNTHAYASPDLNNAINIITKSNLSSYIGNSRQLKRLLDTIHDETFALFIYNNIDHILKVHQSYNKAGILLLNTELRNLDEYEKIFNNISTAPSSLNSAAEYYNIVSHMERIWKSDTDLGVLQLDINYSTPFFNFSPYVMNMPNKYTHKTYIIMHVNTQLYLHIDYHRFLS